MKDKSWDPIVSGMIPGMQGLRVDPVAEFLDFFTSKNSGSNLLGAPAGGVVLAGRSLCRDAINVGTCSHFIRTGNFIRRPNSYGRKEGTKQYGISRIPFPVGSLPMFGLFLSDPFRK